jgi:two-component system OmpR family response regulator
MLKAIHLLLVDDEELFVKNLTQVLTRRGMTVQGAGDGAAAIELLSSKEPDFYNVVVLDMRMPGMNGLETLKAIRRHSAMTPVILLTGHADLKEVSELLKEGVSEVLLKPCPIDTLISTIENVHERTVMSIELAGKCDR